MSDETVKLESGKRYRLTFEGTATKKGLECPRGVFFTSWFDRAASVERLPDPEPEWRPGDVVRVSPYMPFQRTWSGGWAIGGSEADVYTEIVSAAHTAGTLEIMYRQ